MSYRASSPYMCVVNVRASSPPRRGTQSEVTSHLVRIIPAYAGNTPSPVCSWRRGPHHPHEYGEHFRGKFTPQIQRAIPARCGEYAVGETLNTIPSASSPHERGTLPSARVLRVAVRTIPAYAGNTSTFHFECVVPSHHPRAHGELLPYRTGGCSDPRIIPTRVRGIPQGRTPFCAVDRIIPATRERGTLCCALRPPRKARIIPAHTGNTEGVRTSPKSPTASSPLYAGNIVSHIARISRRTRHPRTRGEHLNGGHDPIRIIPAHTGNTLEPGQCLSGYSHHPRAHGEHPTSRTPTSQRTASSPLFAGNTNASPGTVKVWAHHPRAHREHGGASTVNPQQRASSPRTRGTLDELAYAFAQARIIPVHTGNTKEHRVA